MQNSYGGWRGLQAFVDACHAADLAVVLDVVYNHLGPEGNYLAEFAPYFTDVYRTPWGTAINFDGPGSDGVRRYFLENALQWIEDFHIDGLRLDATHAILDRSAKTFLEELAEAVEEHGLRSGRRAVLIAESDANDPQLVRSRDSFGVGLDAMWSDDFHHAIHALLTGERDGYYRDFGPLSHLVRAWRHGMAYIGDYSPYRERRHGRAIDAPDPMQFVVSVQNHDQVGNRMNGERLSVLVDFESQKLAAGLLLLSPFVPLVFMGQEYGETAPFLYFVSHGDPSLSEAVRHGRQAEFAGFGWSGDVPDPCAKATFDRSRLDHDARSSPPHDQLYRFYGDLLRLRSHLCVRAMDDVFEHAEASVLEVRRRNEAVLVFHFGESPGRVTIDAGERARRCVWDSADARWGGPGGTAAERLAPGENAIELPARSFVVYVAEPGEPRDVD